MRRLRAVALVAALALGLAACSGGRLTLTEYAAETEALVAGMEDDFRSLDADWESAPPSIDRAEDYWEGRLTIRNEFLAGVRALDPPEEVESMHETSIDLFERITAADHAVADRVATFESITDHWQWTETPEGKAADAVLEEVFAFCRLSQAEFDATQGRETLEDVPWIPEEMQEVVKVAFGCPPSP